MFFQSSGGDEEPMSDTEMSRDGDSPDALSRVPPTDVDPDTLEKLKQQVRFFCNILYLLRVFFFTKITYTSFALSGSVNQKHNLRRHTCKMQR